MTRIFFRRSAVSVAVAVLVAGCGGGGGSRELTFDGERVAVAHLTDASAALCQARAEAEGDLTKARATFYDRAHDTLHTIARALEPVDRAQAARLLEAKQAVEADLGAAAFGANVVSDLDRLVDVTSTSLSRLEVEAPPCPS